MAAPPVELASRLLVYAALLVAVPLSFVLLFRAIDYLALDGLTGDDADGFPAARRVSPPVSDAIDRDGVPCPRCGTRNDDAYTFCRSCQARVGARGTV